MAAVWPVDSHTLAKHELLRRYPGAWFPILTFQGYHGRVGYIDGFSGPGIYEGGEPGSPLIALRTLVEHPRFDQLAKTEFVFLFIEKDRARFESLRSEIQKFWAAVPTGQPPNVKYQVANAEFADVAEELVAKLGANGRQIAPTFAMIDPFGWKGVPMKIIAELLAAPRTEVFFTFMYDSINRWIEHPEPAIPGTRCTSPSGSIVPYSAASRAAKTTGSTRCSGPSGRSSGPLSISFRRSAGRSGAVSPDASSQAARTGHQGMRGKGGS
ncbi:MAG TPA: three-Cys-motif partner protein TcmP [Chloroflexota bacterium]|nr:three-Cys-motif partner protein TcmP [Chloroflexota bacterium]